MKNCDTVSLVKRALKDFFNSLLIYDKRNAVRPSSEARAEFVLKLIRLSVSNRSDGVVQFP
jgi:hypothetical protein